MTPIKNHRITIIYAFKKILMTFQLSNVSIILSTLYNIEYVGLDGDINFHSLNGILVIVKDQNSLIFIWKQNKTIQKTVQTAPEKGMKVIYGSFLRKIIVEIFERFATLTFQGESLYKFYLRRNFCANANQFCQILYVNSLTPNYQNWNSILSEFKRPENKPSIHVFPFCKGNVSFPLLYNQANECKPKLQIDLSIFSSILSKFKIKKNEIKYPLSESEYANLLRKRTSLTELKKIIAKRGIDKKLRNEIWPQLLNILPDQSKEIDDDMNNERINTEKAFEFRQREYQQIKFQWQTLKEYQITQFPELRFAFHLLMDDVKHTIPPNDVDPELFKNILTNILKSFAVWNCDIRYVHGLNEVAAPFVIIGIRQSDKRDHFNDDLEIKEALAFWSFVSFIENGQSVLLEPTFDNLLNIDIEEIKEILKKHSKESYKYYQSLQMLDLNFIAPHFILLFRRTFDEFYVERIWDSIISSEYFQNFEYAFTASVLIFLASLLKMKSKYDQNDYLSDISNDIYNLPVDLIISVANVITADLPKRTKRTGGSAPDNFLTDYFRPSMISESISLSSANLFC